MSLTYPLFIILLECEYAYKKNRDLIALRLEKKYSPDGWMEELWDKKDFFDFSSDARFQGAITSLIKKLEQRGKATWEELGMLSCEKLSNAFSLYKYTCACISTCNYDTST